MRYLVPAIFAALMITGCACNQRAEQTIEPEPAPKEVPLLAEVPVIGHTFKSRTATSEIATKEVPLLGNIPLIGHLFKRQAETPAED